MLQPIDQPDRLRYYRSPLLHAAGVPHAFSTRRGGVSAGPFDSLNLGNPGGCEQQDDVANIARNFELLQSAIGLGSRRRCSVHQVHGDEVVEVATSGDPTPGARADALVTGRDDVILSIRTADCVPILLASEDGKRVAAVHAGWRGAIADVAQRTVERLGGVPSQVIAAIGPCIGFQAFEVGPEVAEAFRERFGRRADVLIETATDGDRSYVDLASAIQIQLEEAGVAPHRIDRSDRCTHRDADEFFSHRRDRGVTGRMAALIAVRARGGAR